LASTFTGPIRIKTRKKLWRKGSLGVSRAFQIFWVPLLSQERVKLQTSNFVGTFKGWIGTKAHEKNLGIVYSRGHSQGVQKIFRAPTYRAHCAVIFVIAQLSHEVLHLLYISKFTRLRAVFQRQHGSCYIMLCCRQRLWLRLGINVDDQLWLRLNHIPIPNCNHSANPSPSRNTNTNPNPNRRTTPLLTLTGYTNR